MVSNGTRVMIVDGSTHASAGVAGSSSQMRGGSMGPARAVGSLVRKESHRIDTHQYDVGQRRLMTSATRPSTHDGSIKGSQVFSSSSTTL